MFSKKTKLFIFLSFIFLTNALTAEFMGVKVFDLNESISSNLPAILLFGEKMEWQFTTGVLLWPFVFVLTDTINDYFGVKGVKQLSLLTVGMIIYAFIMIYLGIHTVAPTWWKQSGKSYDIDDAQNAYHFIFGSSNWIIVGSLIAFLVGQLTDAYVFKAIKKWSGERGVWIRATISTLISQFIDSYVVIYVAFVIGGNWTITQFFQVATMNYILKFILAIVMIPLLLVISKLIDRYLGKELAKKIKTDALDN